MDKQVESTGLHHEAHEHAIAIWFMHGANRHHYAYLQEIHQSLNCMYLYPCRLTKAYNVMLRRSGDRVQYTPTSDGLMFSMAGEIKGGEGQQQPCGEGTTLATQGAKDDQEAVAGTDGKLFPNMRCYECNQYGHYASHSPQASDTNKHEPSQQCLTVSISFTQQSHG